MCERLCAPYSWSSRRKREREKKQREGMCVSERDTGLDVVANIYSRDTCIRNTHSRNTHTRDTYTIYAGLDANIQVIHTDMCRVVHIGLFLCVSTSFHVYRPLFMCIGLISCVSVSIHTYRSLFIYIGLYSVERLTCM